MKIIGLCGSSGAGKGYVSLAFEKHGIPCIDTDKVYREITTKKGSDCLRELVLEFGNQILTENGQLNKAELAKIVFESNGAKNSLKRLNEIAHRYIKIDTEKIIESHAKNGAWAVVIDAPVLFESGFDKMCDFTVCVLAPIEEKIARIIARDGITREKAQLRLNNQLSDSELSQLCTYKIDNSGADIEAQIINILKIESIKE